MVETSIKRKPEKPWGWPTHLQIEPSAHCNLRCVFCPVTEGMTRPKGHMSFSLLKRIIDEIGDYLLFIILWDWGEPFLNPSIYKMIAYIKKKSIKTISSTNGHIFVREKHAERVIQSGLDALIVSMDGISQETYEVYRKKGKLALVLDGIRAIVEQKRALGFKTPLINLRFIVMKHNEHEVPKLKAMAESLGVDVLTLRTLNPYYKIAPQKDEFKNAFIPESDKYRRFAYSKDGKTPVRVRRNPCKNLWNNPAIHWNGILCPCTYDYDEDYILGDLNKDTFKNIWFGASYRKMRRQFRLDWEGHQLCRYCSYAYLGGEERIAETFFLNRTDSR